MARVDIIVTLYPVAVNSDLEWAWQQVRHAGATVLAYWRSLSMSYDPDGLLVVDVELADYEAAIYRLQIEASKMSSLRLCQALRGMLSDWRGLYVAIEERGASGSVFSYVGDSRDYTDTWDRTRRVYPRDIVEARQVDALVWAVEAAMMWHDVRHTN